MKRRKRAPNRQRLKGRYRFTRHDCQRGYRAALEKCSQDWDLCAWFFHRLRAHYRRKERQP